ncbi:peptidylprolyl isomerase [Massilia antarctica]|uniref:peptidylprolyl isomerase n=1 Tax=Massilia antarctica TaxID=2765360 RepID=UPI0006BB7B9D|nr:peptidylprolyl isomerase [Massilia sp. H27-R4]MCY0915388.1 peptidylprolyl isomerase [Massilia sp. H27-R4]CUI05850.1 Foldase protein PrsA precursor [Janthinobacterium sp. CG23_2]CUU29636.1 Foldase protein PrsA precursor [Janthinobacterium sp. CG23_2]
MTIIAPTPRLLAALLVLASTLGPAHVAHGALDDASVAAHINGAPVHALTLRALQYQARDLPGRPSADAVLADIVADRLQADWSRARFSAAQLYPASTVGFAPEVGVDDRLVGLLRSMYAKELEAALRALPGATLAGVIEATFPLAPAQLDRLFGAPGALRLGHDFSAEQAALAAQTPLLRFRLGSAPAVTLSLRDVYQRQNVQGRMDFFNRKADFIYQQARLRVAGLFVLDWAERKFGAQALADLRQALDEQEAVRGAMRQYGLAEGAEAHSTLQAALARQVTQAEIGAYYAAHKDQFRRTEKVRARHIRVDSETLATRIAAEAAAGKDFGLLARRHSTAPDAARGGDLGWVMQTDDPDWLSALALLQPEGKVSSPFRAPVGPGAQASWDIVLVDKRVEGYHPPDSETVRYMARKAIAHERARAEFAAARSKLVRAATVAVNRKLLDEKAGDTTGAP